MGKPLMLQEDDANRIEALRRRLGIHTKVGVVRTAIDLLEQDTRRREAGERWRRAAGRAAATSRAVNTEFRRYSRLKRT